MKYLLKYLCVKCFGFNFQASAIKGVSPLLKLVYTFLQSRFALLNVDRAIAFSPQLSFVLSLINISVGIITFYIHKKFSINLIPTAIFLIIIIILFSVCSFSYIDIHKTIKFHHIYFIKKYILVCEKFL